MIYMRSYLCHKAKVGSVSGRWAALRIGLFGDYAESFPRPMKRKDFRELYRTWRDISSFVDNVLGQSTDLSNY